MSNDRHDVKQLKLNFDAIEQTLSGNRGFPGLSLIVNNPVAKQPAASALEPNSPEITNIIRKLGKSLGW